jgi:hypothetical protein
MTYLVEQVLEPRSFVFSSNAETLVLQSTQPETKLTFINKRGESTLDPKYVLSSSNDSFAISRNDQTMVDLRVHSSSLQPQMTVLGEITTSNLRILPGAETNKAIILQDYNYFSENQFAGLGYVNGVFRHQVPTRNAKVIFQAAAMNSVNAEWMRLQEDTTGHVQLGVGTNVLTANTALTVAGNAEIRGTLKVDGGIDFDTSEFVKLEDNNRISPTILPEKVPLLDHENKVHESVLPTSYNFQYLKTQKNVGIGTRHPVQKFHVHGSMVASERLGIGTLHPSSRMHVLESSGTIPTARFENTSSGNVLEAYSNGTLAFLVEGTHGAVGIGTSAVDPRMKLHVAGDALVDGSFACSNFNVQGGLTTHAIHVQDPNGRLIFRTEVLEAGGVREPFVTANAPYIFGMGLATNMVTSTNSSTNTVLFKDTNIEIQGNTVLASSPIVISDIRKKFDIVRIEGALAKISNMRGYTYHIGDGKRHAGVIAQEVQQSLPEAVVSMPDTHLAVRYESLIPLLLEAIHELTLRVAQLERT